MKIELGKIYKTRNGQKTVIHAIYHADEATFPVHGSTQDVKNGWIARQWHIDGHWMTGSRNDSNASSEDIVGEWVDPKPRLLAWFIPTNGYIVLESDELKNKTMHHNGYTRAPWLDQPEDQCK